jgi:transcriptional regulator with XRE-family HTH domain
MFEPLSDLIRLRRRQMGMTQEKLAHLAKVSRRQLSLLEDGHNVSLVFLTKVANVLELTDIPVGNLRLFSAPPTLGPMIRTAEVVEILREAFESLGVNVEKIRGASATLNELVAEALAPPAASTGPGDGDVLALAPAPATDSAADPADDDNSAAGGDGR